MIPVKPKTNIDSYFDQTKPHIRTLIEKQLKEMGSAKIIMTLWVIWKKPIKLLVDLDPEDLEDAQGTRVNSGNKGRPAPPVNTSPQEKEEVENELNEWYGWLVNHAPKPIKNAAGNVFLKAKNSILGLYDVKKTLKGNQKQTGHNTDLTTHENEWDGYTRIEMPFNSIMTQFFQGSDNNDLIERMVAYIKAQTENPKFPESGFTLDKIMHLYINFHGLVLTQGSSYTELPKWDKIKRR